MLHPGNELLLWVNNPVANFQCGKTCFIHQLTGCGWCIPQYLCHRFSIKKQRHFPVAFADEFFRIHKFHAHQIVAHTPAQIDGHVVTGAQIIHPQTFLRMDHKYGIIHIAGESLLRKRSSGDGILAGGIDDKTDA